MKIRYDATLSHDGGRGGLRILYPVRGGYIEYTFVHSVVHEKNCDIWRMSVVNALDEKGEFLHRLTKGSAEWEMAIRLEGRPDFIGGFNHGDEIGCSPSFRLDGESVTPEELSETRDFSRLEITVESTGFDPASPTVPVLSHKKEYLYDESGVDLHQEVIWQKDVTLATKMKSYLAMMPPLKHDLRDEAFCITDSFAFGDGGIQSITHLPIESEQTKGITVEGNSYRFTMQAREYAPLYPNSYLAFLTDNGKLNYNKMYISFAGGRADFVSAGTKWNARTHYRIEKK